MWALCEGEAPAQPAASGGGGFLAACFEEQATPDFDVDTIHLRYPITDDERVRNAPLPPPHPLAVAALLSGHSAR